MIESKSMYVVLIFIGLILLSIFIYFLVYAILGLSTNGAESSYRSVPAVLAAMVTLANGMQWLIVSKRPPMRERNWGLALMLSFLSFVGYFLFLNLVFKLSWQQELTVSVCFSIITAASLLSVKLGTNNSA